MSRGSRVSIDRVVVHGGRLDAGDVTRLPAAIRAALGRPAAKVRHATGVEAIAARVAEAVHAHSADRGGVR